LRSLVTTSLGITIYQTTYYAAGEFGRHNYLIPETEWHVSKPNHTTKNAEFCTSFMFTDRHDNNKTVLMTTIIEMKN